MIQPLRRGSCGKSSLFQKSDHQLKVLRRRERLSPRPQKGPTVDTQHATLRFSAGGKHYRLGIPALKASILRAVIAARASQGRATPLQVRQRTITKEGGFDHYVFTVLGSGADFSLEFPVDHSPAPPEDRVRSSLAYLTKNPWMPFSLDL